MSKELTLKQRRFIDEFIKDGNGTRSVRVAYPNIKTEKARGVMATRLIGNDRIRESIEKALEAKNITPEVVMDKFITIADRAKYDRDKIAAWRNVADIAGFTRKEPSIIIGQQALFLDDKAEEDARRVIAMAEEEEQKQSVVSLPDKKQEESSTDKQTKTGGDSLPPAKLNAHIEGAD